MAKAPAQHGTDSDENILYLSSHLRPPHYSIDLVERPGLAAQLDRAGAHRLMLVHAPAGFGKTTALYQWANRLQARGVPVCWLSVGPEDSDSHRFLYHLQCSIAAARNDAYPLSGFAGRSFRKRSLQADIDAIIARLTAGERLVLIIDDYHLAESARNDRILNELVKALDGPVTIAISSRARPALSLPYFQCQGLLASIDASTLRFSEDECRALFAASGLARAASTLYRQSGGWPMALQLAKLWLREGADPEHHPELDAHAAGITEYLTGEVIRKLPFEVAGLLLDTSILERVNGDVANRLTGRDDCWALIDRLAALDALIVPLQGRGGWFRYHPLFREILQGQLASRGAPYVAELHIRACNWYAEQRELESAVMHAAQARDSERIAALIESEGAVRIGLTKGMSVLRRLLRTLSPEVVYTHPRLHLAQIWLLAKQGEVTIARSQYDQYFDNGALRPDSRTRACSDTEKESLFVGMMLAEVYEDKDFDRTEIERIESVARDVASVDHWFQGWVNNLLCIMHTRKGNFDSAMAASKAADFHYRRVGSEYGQVWMLLHRALVSLLDGRLENAARTIGNAAGRANREFSNDSGLIGIIRIVESAVLLERGETGRAAEGLFDALATAENAEGWVEVFVQGYRAAIELSRLNEGFDNATQHVEGAMRIARERSLPRLARLATLFRIELHTLCGRLDDAVRLTRFHGLAVDSLPRLEEEGWQERVRKAVVLARLAIYRGAIEEVLDPLYRYVEAAEACGRRRVAMELSVVLAMAEYERGRRAPCVEALRNALDVAVPEGFHQVFAREGRLMARMLDETIRHIGVASMSKETVAFLARLVAGLRQPGDGNRPAAASNILTHKELEVLKHAACGNPSKIIARRLNVSVATVKYHLSNIYRKLGARSRIMAVAIAREHDLL